MIKERLESFRTPRGLFYSLIASFGVLTLMMALCVFLLFSQNNSGSGSAIAIGSWINNTLINVGAGLIIVVILATMTRIFNLQESTPGEFSGYHLMRKWRDERPHPAKFKELFSNAAEVQIVGVTLNHTFIQSQWFCEVLAKRIQAGKKTQFLLLDPNGSELARREKEGGGRSLKTRALDTQRQIFEGLKLAGIKGAERNQYYLTFDFAPPANLLRFGETTYVVLFMYGAGDYSPALILDDADSFLFRRYREHFERMWED
jgi:hypothetical protein